MDNSLIASSPVPVPGKALLHQSQERTNLGALYILYYRTGMNPRPQEIYFQRNGTFQEVVAYAKYYCEKLNYRFVIVKKFLTDVEEDLRRFSPQAADG